MVEINGDISVLDEYKGKLAEVKGKQLPDTIHVDDLSEVELIQKNPDIIGNNNITELISQSDAATKWGTLSDGNNQGVVHFCNYRYKYPKRIQSLADRLGVPVEDFDYSVKGFSNFTNKAEYVIDQAKLNGTVRQVGEKTLYYMEGVKNPKKGVVVVVYDGKIQSVMSSDINSFNNMK